MTITREQILKIKKDLPWHGDVSSLDISDLCDLALRGLETQWRPIETAPKDGTEFQAWLVKDGKGRWLPKAQYNPSTKRFEIYGNDNYTYNAWRELERQGLNGWQPAYWMPQPEEPKP